MYIGNKKKSTCILAIRKKFWIVSQKAPPTFSKTHCYALSIENMCGSIILVWQLKQKNNGCMTYNLDVKILDCTKMLVSWKIAHLKMQKNVQFFQISSEELKNKTASDSALLNLIYPVYHCNLHLKIWQTFISEALIWRSVKYI